MRAETQTIDNLKRYEIVLYSPRKYGADSILLTSGFGNNWYVPFRFA
jgi:hypothetical protein